MGWRTARASGFFDSFFSPIAVDVHFEDRGVVNQAVNVRIPTKPAMHSNMKPATHSDLKPAGVPI